MMCLASQNFDTLTVGKELLSEHVRAMCQLIQEETY
jgi:hypothetical protein